MKRENSGHNETEKKNKKKYMYMQDVGEEKGTNMYIYFINEEANAIEKK